MNEAVPDLAQPRAAGVIAVKAALTPGQNEREAAKIIGSFTEPARTAETGLGAEVRAAPELPGAASVSEPAPARLADVAPPEPTVKKLDLEGREIDTFATEREFGGVRERQAGLPMGAGELPTETAGPLFAARRTPLDDALRDIAEERRLAQEALADPRSRRQRGALADLRTRIAARDEEEAIIRRWQEAGYSPEEQAAHLREMEMELANQAGRLEMRKTREWHPAYGTREAAEEEFARRGKPSAAQRRARQGPGMARAQIEAREEALDQLQARLKLPDVPPQADEIVSGIMADSSLPPERLRPAGGGSGERPPPKAEPPRRSPAELQAEYERLHVAGGEPFTEPPPPEHVIGDLVENPSVAPALSVQPVLEVPQRSRMWSELEGTLNLAWRQTREEYDSLIDDIRVIARNRSDPEARQLALDVLHVGGQGRRTPLTEKLFLAVHGEAPIESLPSSWQKFAKRMALFIAQEEEQTIARFPEFSRRTISKYYPRFWKRGGRALEEGGKVPTGPGTGKQFLAHRQYDNFAQGLELGDEPASWNPLRLYVQRRGQGFRLRLEQDVVDMLKTTRRAVPSDQAPRGWVVPDIPAFQPKAIMSEDGTIHAVGVAVHPDDAKILRRMFPPVQDEFDPIHFAAQMAGVAKRVKIGAFSLFQHNDLTLRGTAFAVQRHDPKMLGVVGEAWVRAFLPGGKRRLSQRILNDPDLRLIESKGLEFGGGQEIRAIGRGLSDEALRFPLLGDIPMPKHLKGAQRLLNDMYGYWTGSLFEGVHTGIAQGMAKRIFKLQVAQGLSREEAATRTGQIVNEFLSNIPDHQSVISSPRLRNLFRAIIFSVNENEAWFKMPWRAVVGPNRTLAAAQLAGLYVQAAVMADLINLAFTGEHLSLDQLKPIQMNDGRPEFNSRFLRPKITGDGWLGRKFKMTGGLGRDLYLDLLGQADTPLRFALSPEFAVRSRLSTPLSLAWDLARGKTYFEDEPIDVTSKQGLIVAGQQLGIPLAAGGFIGDERQRIGRGGALIQAGGFNVSSQRLSEIRADIMRAERANLVGQYDKFPPDRLDPTDRAFLEGKYPELFVEPGEQYTQETVGGISEEQRRALRSTDLDAAQTRKTEGLDTLADEADKINASEQTLRKNLEDLGVGYLATYRAQSSPVFEELESSEVGSEYQRLAERYGALQDKYANRFTSADSGPAWDAYQAEFDSSFTTEEQAILSREFGVNDHPWEAARTEMIQTLRPYWEIQGRTDSQTSKQRETYRARHPEIDGILWALGRTSVVRSARGQSEAIKAFERLYGVTLTRRDVRRYNPYR